MSDKFKKYIIGVLRLNFNKTVKTATVTELYNAVGRAFSACCDDLYKENSKKRACYFSAEFLMGRVLESNLFNLDILTDVEEMLNGYGRSLEEFREITDPGLGNGGLGRLAAGFLDSAASLDIPLDGYGIRYSYGYFRQKITDKRQTELPDKWLDFSDAFGRRCDSEKVTVSFRNEEVTAVPYIYYIPGYKNHRINKLCLFSAESENGFDYEVFNNGDFSEAFREENCAQALTALLYPEDSTEKGKLLRLKQQYFFTSAALQMLLKKHLRSGKPAEKLYESIVIQINDTHPTIAIPECIRIMMKEGVSFEAAFTTAGKIFAYTNHTVMAEALEKWDEKLFLSAVPQVYEIIRLINEKLKNDPKIAKTDTDSCLIIRNSTVYMANLACYVAFSINGVAKIHSNIIKKDTLKQWYRIFPERFNNKTNGVTQRRWLALANPGLDGLLKGIAGEEYLSDFDSIKEIEKYRKDKSFLKKLMNIKRQNKIILSEYIENKEGIKLDHSFIFCTQIKRIHEYKRQLMNILSVIEIYLRLKEGSISKINPTLFILGGKAAPGYKTAKRIIEFINIVADKINSDSETNNSLMVVFVENYNVSYAEKIIPATDISEQISLAGKEASGTGNMKFMMNGAVTLGTYDGANIEIFQKAGEENNYVFGLREEEVVRIKENYNPREVYLNNTSVKRTVDTLINNTFLSGSDEPFTDIYKTLIEKDEYLVLKDLPDYIEKKLKAIADYGDFFAFAEKSAMNIANSFDFSCDRTIEEYAENIWFKENP